MKYAQQGGLVPEGRLKQGRMRSQGWGQSSLEPGRGSRLGPRSPPGVGALIQVRGSQRGKHCSSNHGGVVGATEPVSGGGVATDAGVTKR